MIVSKEIARKLRDIGFREPTDYFYNHYGEEGRRAGRESENEWAIAERFNNSDAPDKSDVFAWFRKKGIIGAVYPLMDGEIYWVIQGSEIWINQRNDEEPIRPNDTWEEAEDKCILKMIELHG